MTESQLLRLLNNKAFTLLELIVTVAIISVLAGSVSPNFIRFKNEFDLKSAYNIFVGDLKLCQNSSMNNDELYIQEKYQRILYGIEIINKNSYKRVIFNSQKLYLKDVTDVIYMSKNKKTVFVDFNEKISNIKYIIFDTQGIAHLIDDVGENISHLPDEPEIMIRSEKYRSHKKIDFNLLTGRIIYEQD